MGLKSGRRGGWPRVVALASGRGQLNQPVALAVTPFGDVYAPGNSVREFSPAGHQLRSFGITQAGYGDLGNPGGLAVGPGGRVYVAQPDYGLVSVFSAAGSFFTEFGRRGPVAQDPVHLDL